MPQYKLTYFDFHGGRGEVARLAFAIGGVSFSDDRISFDTWKTLKSRAPFGGLPILEVDGCQITQSNCINRYVGKLAGLYPEGAWAAALCDEAMDVVEEIAVKIAPTFSMPDEEKMSARHRLAETDIPFYLHALDKRLQAQGDYFGGSKLTVADLKVFVMLRHLKSGRLDYVPTDIVNRHAPALSAHYERVRAHPAVRAYYQRSEAAMV